MLPAEPFATSPGVVRAACSEQEIVSNRVEGVGAACQSHQEKSGEKLKGKTALRIIFSCSSASSKHWGGPRAPMGDPQEQGNPRSHRGGSASTSIRGARGQKLKGNPGKESEENYTKCHVLFFSQTWKYRRVLPPTRPFSPAISHHVFHRPDPKPCMLQTSQHPGPFEAALIFHL